MDVTNEKLRGQFSERLKREFKRLGLPLASPTNIAGEFNKRYPGRKVVPQTVRKWLGAEAMPTQEKMVALADWFGVSPQWLRFGSGERRAASGRDDGHGIAGEGTKSQEELATIFELLTRLTPANLKLAESLIQSVLAQQEPQ